MQIYDGGIYQKAIRRQRLYFAWTSLLAGRPVARRRSCMPVRGLMSAKCFCLHVMLLLKYCLKLSSYIIRLYVSEVVLYCRNWNGEGTSCSISIYAICR
jgi:hypothetical protein